MTKQALVVTILLASICTFLPRAIFAADVLFFEDFEAEDALDAWEVESTNEGRVRIAEDPRDSSNHGLLMDDAVNNAVFSQNIARTSVSVDSYTDIRITLDVYSLNNHVHTENGFDGVVVRAGDMTQRYSTNWDLEQSFDITLDSEMEEQAAAAGFITIELQQYGNFSEPDNGLFFDNVMVTGTRTRDIYVVSPLVALKSEPMEVTVLIDPIPEKDVEVTLLSFGNPHGTATYPAGEMMADLTFPNFDNNRLDGDRFYELLITDGHFSSDPFFVLIEDDTPAGLSLTAPDDIEEGTSRTGTIGVSAERTTSISIELESSDPSVLSVPETVLLSRFASSVNFPITTFEDPRILDDREVTITARVGADVVEQTIVVTERNSLRPILSGPAELTEGDSEVEFTFSLDGISDDELTVTLAAAPGEVSVQPESVTLEPGERDGSFLVSVEDDSILQGNRAFTLTATTTKTGESDTLEGTILDNNIARFAFSLPEMIEADTQESFLIQAVNEDSTVVRAFEGVANIYLKDAASGVEELLIENVPFSGGETTASLNLPYEGRGDELVVRSADGVETISGPLSVFAKLAFAANDFVYDPDREQLYTVSGGAAVSGHLHSVTPIDPDTAEIGDGLFLGGDPRNLVITDDSQYLYVGLWSSYAVQRVALESFTAGDKITLDATGSWSDRSYTPYDLLPVPGRPRDFIVSQNATGSTYRTTRLYIDGEVQPQDSRNAVELAPAGAPDEFYAFNSASTGYDFMRLRLTSDGYETVESIRQFFSGFSTRIAGEDDLIFTSNGRVADGLKMEVIADLQFPDEWTSGYGSPSVTMLPDIERSRMYYAHGNTIAAYDTGVFQLVYQTSVPGIGDISRMARWGETGMALITDNGEVVLFEDNNLVPSGEPTDLSVSISASPEPVFLSEELTYSAVIENIGTVTAQDVVLVIDLNEGQSLGSVNSDGFAYNSDGRTVMVDIGEMNPGDSHDVSVTSTPTDLTTLVGTAAAVTTTLDANYANNTASTVLNVGFNSSPNSINVVQMPINDVLFEPVSGELVVSVAASAHSGIRNRILTLDPTSGLITRSISVPSEPHMLALSDDGTTAYALNPTRTGALRVDLAAGEFVKTVPFGASVNANDIKVLPGTVDSIIIGSGWDGVRVYDDGVVRSKNSGTYNGNLVELLPEPNLVFGYNNSHTGFDSFKFEIVDEGVETLVSTRDLFSGFSLRIESDGYHIYGTDGKAVRADLMNIEGTFPLSEAFSGTTFSATALAPDRDAQRVYYSRNKEVASFDTENHLLVRVKTFDALPAAISSLERWESDGFAARLQNDHLAIIRTDLVSQTPSPIDLLVSLPDGSDVTSPLLSVSGKAFSGQGITSVTVDGHQATTSDGFANWEAVVDGLVEGENTLEITATSFGNPPATRTVTRTVYYDPNADSNGDGLADSWVTEHFGDLESPLADPHLDLDGDGMTNLAEFLFGTDPLEPDSPHVTIDPSQEEGDFSIYLEFVHRESDDWEFIVQRSTDLDNWENFTGDVEAAGEPTPAEGRPHYVKATYRLQPDSESGIEFYRLKAERK